MQFFSNVGINLFFYFPIRVALEKATSGDYDLNGLFNDIGQYIAESLNESVTPSDTLIALSLLFSSKEDFDKVIEINLNRTLYNLPKINNIY